MERVRVEGRPAIMPERPGPSPAPRQAPSFFDRLLEERGRQRLDDLLQRIDRQGAELGQGMSTAGLRRYRDLVRTFLREVLDQVYRLQREAEWDFQRWEHRYLTTVERVSGELDDLARRLLEREQDRLAILARVGEIKGLLLDLML